MGRVQIVVGAQFGSEGKGAIAAYLSNEREYVHAPDYPGERVYCVRVAGPNAGHTVIGAVDLADSSKGIREWKLRQIPVGAVTNPNAILVVAAGSEIDPYVLKSEIGQLDAAGYDVSSRLLVDRSATVITLDHHDREQYHELTGRIGSTAKGIGAARADRIWRTADLFGGDVDTTVTLRNALRVHDARVVIEGTQGYGLGLHTQYYPHVTSSDCRAVDFMAMCGLSPWDVGISRLEVYVVARTRPIRVAGNSGPLHRETSWQQLGLPEEHTTVTGKVRRVGEWDPELVKAAIEANGGPHQIPRKWPEEDWFAMYFCLTMADQLYPGLAGMTEIERMMEREHLAVKAIREMCRPIGMQPRIIGTGPASVIDIRHLEPGTE